MYTRKQTMLASTTAIGTAGLGMVTATVTSSMAVLSWPKARSSGRWNLRELERGKPMN